MKPFINLYSLLFVLLSLAGNPTVSFGHPSAVPPEKTFVETPDKPIQSQTGYTENNKDVVIYPTHWWVGMKEKNLQLLIRGKVNLSPKNFQLKYPGVRVKSVRNLENPHYLVVDLLLSAQTKPGTMHIQVGDFQVDYLLKARDAGNGKDRIKGVNAADFIYLIMPDRFANGDPSNDNISTMVDTVVNRNIPSARHGGDLLGIQQRLDYLQDLGVTALWLNPVVENDMPMERENGRPLSGFHGYWFTDHYQVDARLGGNEAYAALAESIHKRGMKLIQDAVYNHIGTHHWIMQDLPAKDWLNQWESYRNTTYKDQTLMDPYAADIDKKLMSDGWFTKGLPDLNQRNPELANFLIQHAVWTTEEYGIDGWRIDTYAYNDLAFMNRCNAALLLEYPQIGLFAETWVHGVPNQAFFAQNNLSGIPFQSNLPGVTDFQVYYAINAALNQPDGWTEGVTKLYTTLAQDFLYKDPFNHCLHLDNHDLDRFYSVVGENLKKYKMGISWLLTLRGIPQLYYGTEILMKNFKNPSDDAVREDFPGGWPNDPVNKFQQTGRTPREDSAFHWVKTLANYRKNTSALHRGGMRQYVPENGLYVYFRFDDNKTVMVIANTSNHPQKPNWTRFSQDLKNSTGGINVLSGSPVVFQNLTLDPMESMVIEVKLP
jgi:glycosidase